MEYLRKIQYRSRNKNNSVKERTVKGLIDGQQYCVVMSSMIKFIKQLLSLLQYLYRLKNTTNYDRQQRKATLQKHEIPQIKLNEGPIMTNLHWFKLFYLRLCKQLDHYSSTMTIISIIREELRQQYQRQQSKSELYFEIQNVFCIPKNALEKAIKITKTYLLKSLVILPIQHKQLKVFNINQRIYDNINSQLIDDLKKYQNSLYDILQLKKISIINFVREMSVFANIDLIRLNPLVRNKRVIKEIKKYQNDYNLYMQRLQKLQTRKNLKRMRKNDSMNSMDSMDSMNSIDSPILKDTLKERTEPKGTSLSKFKIRSISNESQKQNNKQRRLNQIVIKNKNKYFKNTNLRNLKINRNT